ncbi:hypothetical protein PHMEG_00036032 [Phytophthora megakarya]|uniref:DUF6818 domain-containing protein n=1 Tax=Phytophthora megakarya TaxID=4795 RepID=A0A225UMF4_9STRA|nr:hypothetical protein PHMEG_00036032 [Phytophthora megakarya]
MPKRQGSVKYSTCEMERLLMMVSNSKSKTKNDWEELASDYNASKKMHWKTRDSVSLKRKFYAMRVSRNCLAARSSSSGVGIFLGAHDGMNNYINVNGVQIEPSATPVEAASFTQFQERQKARTPLEPVGNSLSQPEIQLAKHDLATKYRQVCQMVKLQQRTTRRQEQKLQDCLSTPAKVMDNL